jgi:hypothetical protein
MADITAQVVLAMESGMTEDYVSNTMHFTGIQADVTEGNALAAAIKAFYDDVQTYLSGAIAQTGHMVKLYETNAPAPNYPFLEVEWDLASNPTANPLPSEVAICLSFEAARVSGIPQARRRGRIYIGPLSSGVVSSGRPATIVQQDILDAGVLFAGTVNTIPALGTGFWGVWSNTANAFAPAKTLSVDDAFDTQRRRGLAPTSKVTATLPLPA